MSALGHVWTAPWQELSDVAAALVWCGHVSGLFGLHPMSALPPKADIAERDWKVRQVPLADIGD